MPRRITIGIWGTFDLENFGDHLFPLIARRELSQRLPEVELRVFSPLGWEHPTRLDGGQPAEPLGPWGAVRCAELAHELDCVLVGGGEIIHTQDDLLASAYDMSPEEILAQRPSRWFIDGLGPELEKACPVLWHGVGIPFDPAREEGSRLRDALEWRPYVSVRDVKSLERLREAGVNGDTVLVPDSAFLVDRLYSSELLARRRAFHKLMGWVPDGDDPLLVVQGNRDLVRFAPELAASLRIWLSSHPEARVVLAELGACHGDSEFADAIQPLLPQPVFRFPESAGIADMISLIDSATCFAGISMHGSITALAFGRGNVILNLNDQSKLDGLAQMANQEERVVHRPDQLAFVLEAAWCSPPAYELVSRMQSRVDEHFDRIADLAEKSTAQRPLRAPDNEELLRQINRLKHEDELLRRALAVSTQRVIEERVAMADRSDVLWRDLIAATDRLAELEMGHVADLGAQSAATEELNRLMATRTFRYSAGLRARYAALRRMRR